MGERVLKQQTRFAVSKCKVIYTVVNNLHSTHTLMKSKMAATDQERDLEVVGNRLMKLSTKGAAAVKNPMRAVIRKRTRIKLSLSYCPYSNLR